MNRENAGRSEQGDLRFDGLLIEPAARRVVLDGTEISLTRTEFDLLMTLARRAGLVTGTAAILEAVWGTDWVGDGHAVEVQVSRLRQKLGDSPIRPRFIHTVRGIGYRFDGRVVQPESSITYDGNLVVLSVEPDDQPFLGWNPEELVGSFHLLAAGPAANLSQAEAVGIMRAQARVGPSVYEVNMDVQCADGSVLVKRVRFEIFSSREHDFVGARATIL